MIKKIKVSELDPIVDIHGSYAFGIDSDNKNVKIPLSGIPTLEQQIAQLAAEKIAKEDIEQVRSQATNKVASSKLLDDELTKVTNTERPIADIFAYLLGRIEALEELLVASRYNTIQVNELSVVDNIKFKGADLILFGTAAPAVTPDFVGQFFVNTTVGVTYQAKGIVNSGDWKQTSN